MGILYLECINVILTTFTMKVSIVKTHYSPLVFTVTPVNCVDIAVALSNIVLVIHSMFYCYNGTSPC